MIPSEEQNSLYFSLLPGNLNGRKVRTGLRPPPASLGISLCFRNFSETHEFAGLIAEI